MERGEWVREHAMSKARSGLGAGVVRDRIYVLGGHWCAVPLQYTVYSTLSTVHCRQYTVYSIHCLQYTVYRTLSTAHCLQYTVYSTLSTAHCGAPVPPLPLAVLGGHSCAVPLPLHVSPPPPSPSFSTF